MTAVVAGEGSTYPPAELDRRFYAFTLDRLIAWSVDLVVAILAWRLLIAEGSTLAGVLLIVGTVLLVGAVFSVVQGRYGLTPGKALLGLRVVRHGTGEPIGVGPALLRGLVLGVGSLPTFGLGVATLAWTAVMDPDRQRRGWHDHVSGAIVVDVRPAPAPVEEVAPAPRHIVNLTAMRLVPAPQPVPVTPPVLPQRTPAPQTVPPLVAAPAPPLAQPPVQVPAPVPTAHAPEPTALRLPAVTTAERTLVRPGSVPGPARWRVIFDSGESFLVEGLALVGRRPEPRPGEPVRHLVPLRSEDMSLSKTHAQFQVAPDGVLVVTDRGSTNGSLLIRQGVTRALPADKATTLLDGDLVRFGDRQMTVVKES